VLCVELVGDCAALLHQVARFAVACIGNLAVNADNKAVICALKGVEIIVEQQMSTADAKVRSCHAAPRQTRCCCRISHGCAVAVSTFSRGNRLGFVAPQFQSTCLEVLKVFGPNVSDEYLKKRHQGISLESWVRRRCFYAHRSWTRRHVALVCGSGTGEHDQQHEEGLFRDVAACARAHQPRV
jgi:hypothetical protein